MSEPSVKLPAGADELLLSFPGDEPDFEAQAKAIEARLLASPSASSAVMLDGLLKPPGLGAESGEPSAPSQVRPAPRSNFAEMARKSLHRKDDGGAALAKELLAAAAQSRRPSAEMVERVRAAGKLTAAAVLTPLPVAAASGEEPLRPSGVVARAEVVKPVAAASSRGTWIGAAGVGVALAACIALFFKSGAPESATSAALAKEMAADTARPPAAPPRAPAAAESPAKPSDGVVSPEALAAAPEPESLPGKAALKAAARSAAPAAPAEAAPAPGGAGAKPEAVVLEEDAELAKPAPVAEKPKEAEPSLEPAEGNSGGVPLTPSAGAVSTALASVRGGAQACLAGQSEPVVAVVTFAANGHVLQVSAAGPSGACIQAALSKARIQPFARESFSAKTTVRPP